MVVRRVRKADEYLSDAEDRARSAPRRREPSLARQVVVAALDPDSGKIWNDAKFAVPAALLVELVHEGRLAVSGDGRKAEVSVRDATPLGDQELDDALAMVGSGLFGNRVTRLVGRVPQTGQLVERMVADGVLVDDSRKLLGLVPQRRYRLTPEAGRESIAARLRDALRGSSSPDQRTALLVACLLGVHNKLFVPSGEVSEANRRSEEIRAGIGRDELAVVRGVRVALGSSNGDPTTGI